MTLLLTAILAAGLLVGPGISDPGPDPAARTIDSTTYTFDNANSSMTILGSSNVRDWTMDVTRINGRVVLGAASNGEPSIQSVQMELPIEQIVSDKDRLQNHAHEALKKEEHPQITFTSDAVTVSATESDSFAVSASGDLTVAGQTRTIQLSAKGVHANDELSIAGTHELLMSDYDVERPSLMFGAIKVTDPVRIKFDVVLTPSGSESSSQAR